MTDWTFRPASVSKSSDGGKTQANRDVSITVAPGEVYGLLGPNGAGKSTFVKQVIGMLAPDSGTITLMSNIVVFVVMLFTPIVIPIERFPDWLSGLHRALPFYHMTNLLRRSVSDGLVADPISSLAVVVGWTLAAWLAAALVLGRRR